MKRSGAIVPGLALLLCASVLGCVLPDDDPRPVARAGVLRLSGEELYAGRTLALDGEWEFYWQQLIDPADFARGVDARPLFLRVPGAWNNFPGPDGPLPGPGYATLRLRVKGDRFPAGLALKVPTVHTAHILFVNGTRLAANGRVGPSPDWSQPDYRPLVTPVLPAGAELEIVWQISNFDHRKGGTWSSLLLGRVHDLHSEREAGLLLDFFLFGGLIIMGCYHLVLFAFRRGRDRSPLYFGIFCLLIGVRILSTGEHYLALFFPEMPWGPYVKIQYLSFFFAVPAFAFFTYSLFPLRIYRFVLHVVLWPTLGCFLWALISPMRIFSYALLFFEPFTLILGVFLLLVLVPGLLRGEDGVALFMLGWVMLFVSIVNDVLVNRELIQGYSLVGLGVFGFILVQSAILARRFSRAFDLAEQLSENLEAGIRERTAELKASRDELAEARDRAEGSSRAKSEFLAAMSHEIRTPLNSILGAAGLLEEGELNKDQRHQVKMLNRAGSKLLNLINEVLDLSRIEAGKQVLEITNFDPVQSCRELLEIFEQRAREKSIQLELTVTEDFPRQIQGDSIRLEQILLNLLGNAIKFTERGKIELGLARRRATDGEELLEFSVRDTGIGIPPEKMPLIFDSFVQVDQASSRRYEGSGLGLAISKRLVELMGGRISVSSRPGQGSQFRFAIPLNEVGEGSVSVGTPVHASEPTRPEDIAPGTRVLLVEDNEDNRYLIEAYLARAPVELFFAENGQVAVDRVRVRKFDLVLMDIQMPVMDGYEATRRIRSLEAEEDREPLPVIALTANATLEAVRRSIKSGCNDHLTKPIDRERLLSMIARYAPA